MAETRILIAEEDVLVVQEIRACLRDLGYAVAAVATSGVAAVRKAEELRPALVLMDVTLQGKMDGVEAAEQIRDRTGIPVVYLTAYIDSTTLQRARATEPFRYVVKPFTTEALSSTIEMALYKKKADLKLRESEERYRALVENSSDFVTIAGGDGVLRYASPSHERLLGHSPDQLIGKRFLDFSHPDDLPRVKSALGEVLLNPVEPVTVLFRFTCRDGSYRLLETILRNELDKPAVAGIVSNSRDITGRKRVQEALREAESRLGGILSSMADLVFAFDSEGRFIFHHAPGAGALYLSPDEFLGEKYTDVVMPPRLAEPFAGAVEKNRKGEVAEVEYWLEMNDEARWYSAKLSPLFLEGEFSGSVAVVRDITERRQAAEELREYRDHLEELVRARTADLATTNSELQQVIAEREQVEQALRESEERYRTLFDGVPVGLFRSTPDGRCLDANLAFVKMLGYPDRETLLATHATAFYVNPEDRGRWRSTLEREGVVFGVDHQTRRYDGTTIWTRNSSHVVRDDDGQVLYYEGTSLDVTERKRAEEALRESEERYRTLFDGVPVALYRSTPDGRYLDVNLANVAMFRYPDRETLLATNAVEVYVNPADRERWLSSMERDGVVLDFEIPVRRFDGTTGWLRNSARAVYDDDGQPLHYEGSSLDITERKRAEESLRESEEQYRTLFDNVPVGLYRTTPDGRFLDANLAFVKMLGCPDRVTLMATNVVAVYADPDDRRQWQSAMEREGVVYDFDFQMRRFDGATIWIRDSSRVVRDDDGQVLHHEGSALDITERKRAEDALQESEEVARALLNASREAALLVDLRGTVLAANSSAAARFGRSVDDLLGLHHTEIYPEPASQALIEARVGWFREAVRSSKPVRFQDECAGMSFDIGFYPIVDAQGKATRMAIFSRDITAIKQAEQQAIHDERLKATGRLAAALAHEVNNPLQAIRSNLELVADFDLGAEEREQRLRTSLMEVERLTKVTERALNFARPSEGIRSVVSPAELVQRTLALADRHVQHAGTVVTTAVPVDLPPLLAAPEQVVQVLLNLLLNAVEAMPDGGHIQIAAYAQEQTVVLTVLNDGKSIPAAHLPYVFEPFYTTKPDGIGLGLGVCRTIVELSGGTIRLENLVDGEGAVATVTWPVASPDEREEIRD